MKARAALDLSLMVALLASFLLIPKALAHVVAGLLFATLVLPHLWTRRRLVIGLARRVGRSKSALRRRVLFDAALAASVIGVTISGLLQWQGVAAARPWHSVTSSLVLVFVLQHVWRRRPATPRPCCSRCPHTGPRWPSSTSGCLPQHRRRPARGA